jgi:penicillin amidase
MARRSFFLLRWLRRLIGGAFAIVGVLLLALFVALWRSLPGGDLTAAIPGLTAEVHVALDADGVPVIRAESEEDAAAALGFLHARERMFQMEMMRRGASGRASEIAGPATLRFDRFTRVLGLRHAAQRDYATMPPDLRAVLDAYARGVNAWIAGRGRFAGAEFVLLGAPEPWTPVDSLLWGKSMGMFLSGNHRAELLRAGLAGALPPDRLRELWPTDDQAGRPEAALDPTGGDHSRRLLAELPVFPQPLTHPSSASNGWAVDGRFSAGGAPLLAGDPHLGFLFPSLWYLARIELPGRVLTGATAPGVPGRCPRCRHAWS